MRNLAFHRAPAMLTCGLALMLCTTAVTATPAGARSARRTAHTSRADRAPVRLSVVGGQLTWSPVAGVSDYVVRQRLGRHRLRRVLAATAVGLKSLRGGTASYSVRTDVTGSAWASITIVYGSAGTIVKVYGEQDGSGSEAGSGEGSSGAGRGSGSGSESSSGGSGSGGSGSGGSGSGSESGSGAGGSGSGSESGSGAGGSGSESESGSGAGGSGSESESGSGSETESESATGGRHQSAGLKVGLVGGIYGWGQTASETIRKGTGVKFTKLTVGPEGWGTVEEMIHDGVTPLILYNPGMAGMTPAAVAAELKTYVPHMHELGLTEIELGNEVYYNGSTAWEYAAQYKAAHEALAGSGITLIADAWTDTPKANGEWSQWEAGGGWCVLFVQALGYVPDAWSFHPYGPMTADGFGSSGVWRTGWDTVPRMISYMKADHIYAPLDITEVGQPTWEGSDGNTAVTEAEQAQDVKQYIRQASEWGLTGIYLYEAIDTGEGGYGLYKWPLQAKPSAAAFAETLQELAAKPGVLAGDSQFASLPSSAKSALLG
jgi:hypothetical protein